MMQCHEGKIVKSQNQAGHETTVLLGELQQVVVDFTTRFIEGKKEETNSGTRRKRFRYSARVASKRELPVALRIAYLASVCHSNISRGCVLTKRDIYYMCSALFPSPATVDRALAILAADLDVPRNDLNVVAAPKGLVSGCLSFVDEEGNAVNVGMFSEQGCLIPSRPERAASIETDADALVVIEKEASFHSLLSERVCQELLKTCVIVTGKGYPDLATRILLDQIHQSQLKKGRNLPIYVLTDADPHGISIAYCYIRDLQATDVRWVGVRPSDADSLYRISAASALEITERENSLIDCMVSQFRIDAGRGLTRTSSLLSELKVLKATQKKFEMEALASNGFGNEMSALMRYLLQRMDESRDSTERISLLTMLTSS